MIICLILCRRNNMPKYGDKTQKKLENYLVGYTSEKRDISIPELDSSVKMQINDIARHAINYDLKYYDRGVKWDVEEVKIMGSKQDKFYFNNFAFYVGKLSRGQIELSNVEIDRIHTLRAMIKRREPFAPIEQTKIDVPCACCSSTMLPHAKRLNIQADLFKANSLSDYANLLKKYDKFVGHYAADYRDIFLNIVNQNPNISMEDFLIEFDKKVEKFAKYEVILALEDFDDSIEYLKSEGTPEQLKLATTIRERMHKYIASGMFADYNYTNLLRNVLGDIDLDCPECSKGVYVLLDDMKKVA